MSLLGHKSAAADPAHPIWPCLKFNRPYLRPKCSWLWCNTDNGDIILLQVSKVPGTESQRPRRYDCFIDAQKFKKLNENWHTFTWLDCPKDIRKGYSRSSYISYFRSKNENNHFLIFLDNNYTVTILIRISQLASNWVFFIPNCFQNASMSIIFTKNGLYFACPSQCSSDWRKSRNAHARRTHV